MEFILRPVNYPDLALKFRAVSIGDKGETMAISSAKCSRGLGLFLVFAMAAAANAADLKVLSTVGVQTVVEALAPEFERMTGHNLAITFGVSNLMKQQIAAGESFDVAIMTST